MCVPAYIQKLIFGSDIRFGMYEKIFSKIKIKMTGPRETVKIAFPCPEIERKKNSYNLMSVTVHFFFILLYSFATVILRTVKGCLVYR